MPLFSRGHFRSREKLFLSFILLSLLLLCFGSIFFLPDKIDVSNKVFAVYKVIRDSGHEFILPPVDSEAQNGVLDRPDSRIQIDKERLMAQIKAEKNDVLIKPNFPTRSDVSSSLKGFSSSQVSNGTVLISNVDEKRDFIKKMMTHAWNGYVTYAWGHNELRPISLKGHSSSIFGSSPMGATIVDAMDTLYIMGMKEEFDKCTEWIQGNLNFDKMLGDVSVFETNIRFLGGLLSSYSLTGNDVFKEKAVHIADKLLPAFDTPTGIPNALINIKTGKSKTFGWASGGCSILSEFGTLHMEFAYLSDITGDNKYYARVQKIREVIISSPRPKNLYPNYLNPKTGKWCQQHSSLGALGDSFYEYLLKEWLRSGDQESKRLFDEASQGLIQELVQVSKGGLTYFAEIKYGRIEHKMDHLACFSGGLYALAGDVENKDDWKDLGREITNTCHESYERAESKLGPEAFRFSESSEAKASKQNERYYILRPETIESYFILWRLTHEEKYRDWGWEAALALEKNCRSPAGYSGLKNVYQVNGLQDDVQQSFFLAETLKYLYLLFSNDDVLSLNDWVFNTEAHPLPIKGRQLYRPFSQSVSPSNKSSSFTPLL